MKLTPPSQSTEADKKAFTGVVLSEMYSARALLKSTAKKIELEEFTVKDLKKKFIHLTNFSINKRSENFV